MHCWERPDANPGYIKRVLRGVDDLPRPTWPFLPLTRTQEVFIDDDQTLPVAYLNSTTQQLTTLFTTLLLSTGLVTARPILDELLALGGQTQTKSPDYYNGQKNEDGNYNLWNKWRFSVFGNDVFKK
ncbi:hypothetical protein AC579_2931 [Pseudocercospora musae]|uniref:Uncharacterized protein n=1 Tax=Pseudocercospora musae TaxID=113226 RepID=A0A139IU09_9PEZI|nr:hypothetical protein AC579_2931 [Pseudocercospora musae]